MKKYFTFIVLSIFSPSLLAAENDFSAYLNSNSYEYSNPEWMKSIPDAHLISELSIPGTHQSLSRYGEDDVRTQSLSISSQLFMGVRFFDVGFKYTDENLYAYNGESHQNGSFDSFMYDINIFLEAHPSEVVLIRIQNESSAPDGHVNFYNKFISTIKEYKNNHYVPKSNNFYLGNARGKFVFINDIGTKNRIGMSMNSLFIQNKNVLNSKIDLISKWQQVKQHLVELDDFSAEQPAISLNYLTGEGGVKPYFVASGKVNNETDAAQDIVEEILTDNADEFPDFPRKNCIKGSCQLEYLGINQLLVNWINSQNFSANLGIIVADFPGEALVQAIINNNKDIFSTKPEQ